MIDSRGITRAASLLYLAMALLPFGAKAADIGCPQHLDGKPLQEFDVYNGVPLQLHKLIPADGGWNLTAYSASVDGFFLECRYRNSQVERIYELPRSTERCDIGPEKEVQCRGSGRPSPGDKFELNGRPELINCPEHFKGKPLTELSVYDEKRWTRDSLIGKNDGRDLDDGSGPAETFVLTCGYLGGGSGMTVRLPISNGNSGRIACPARWRGKPLDEAGVYEGRPWHLAELVPGDGGWDLSGRSESDPDYFLFCSYPGAGERKLFRLPPDITRCNVQAPWQIWCNRAATGRRDK